jgi:hypothetical protein
LSAEGGEMTLSTVFLPVLLVAVVRLPLACAGGHLPSS